MDTSLFEVGSVHSFQSSYFISLQLESKVSLKQDILQSVEGISLLPSTQGENEVFAIQLDMLLGLH